MGCGDAVAEPHSASTYINKRNVNKQTPLATRRRTLSVVVESGVSQNSPLSDVAVWRVDLLKPYPAHVGVGTRACDGLGVCLMARVKRKTLI